MLLQSLEPFGLKTQDPDQKKHKTQGPDLNITF